MDKVLNFEGNPDANLAREAEKAAKGKNKVGSVNAIGKRIRTYKHRWALVLGVVKNRDDIPLREYEELLQVERQQNPGTPDGNTSIRRHFGPPPAPPNL